jgi:hypothetical protein
VLETVLVVSGKEGLVAVTATSVLLFSLVEATVDTLSVISDVEKVLIEVLELETLEIKTADSTIVGIIDVEILLEAVDAIEINEVAAALVDS